MIRCKNNVEELIKKQGSFKYFKESAQVDVSLKSDELIRIRYNNPKCIVINFFNYDDAISRLYKDRKYINKYL
ncbi:hypothetical protein CLTEP_07820 [Clostridium tepidiprofundi DSM 19306]|uniref:Uncharacterized protein n=1 Tax=Clostridium tepidiprofundi DSM 19306 TaxID=1121338 RepID=A0A151B5H3_9CLOT|nr:hypothetical protein CLTEP_07820 [Clostridium tepidiprofundi DSM 19306]